MNKKNDKPRFDSETSSCEAEKKDEGPSGPIVKRYASLDHWRGIACLLVLINHATLPVCGSRLLQTGTRSVRTITSQVEQSATSTGSQNPVESLAQILVASTTQMHFGVEMFFVISGYCITASALSLRRSGNTNSEFLRRRFLRIYPPFWCALFFSVLACFAIDRMYPRLLEMKPWPLPVPWQLSPSRWLGSLTLTETWLGYFTGDRQLCFPIQAWTLCYEEQFYAVTGVLLALSGRRFFHAATLVTAAVFLIDVAVLVFHFPIHGFFFDEHWFMFASGIGIYWCLHHATPQQSRRFQAFLTGSMIGLLVLSQTTSLFGRGTEFSALRVIGALGFALLLVWLKRYDELLDGIRSLRWLKTCGVMCYSIYLVHLFPGKLISQCMLVAGYTSDIAILLVCIPLVIAVSVALGYLFHVNVERRFMTSFRERHLPSAEQGAGSEPPEPASDSEAAGWTISIHERSTMTNRQKNAEESVDPKRRKAA